jgi:hypothetical protein
MPAKNKSRSERFGGEARLLFALSLLLYLLGAMIIVGYIIDNAAPEIAFGVMNLAMWILVYMGYSHFRHEAVKEELREYLDSRLNEVINEIRQLRESKQN